MLVTQLCLTLCDPMDCNPPGSSVHGILQARILERVAISFSRGSSWPRDRTQIFFRLLHLQAGSLPLGLPGKATGGPTLNHLISLNSEGLRSNSLGITKGASHWKSHVLGALCQRPRTKTKYISYHTTIRNLSSAHVSFFGDKERQGKGWIWKNGEHNKFSLK